MSADSGDSFELYLKEIGQIQLLTKEQEGELGRRALVGDQVAHDLLVRSNLRFVIYYAKKYQNQGLSLPDLVQEGNVGLSEAAWRFDPGRGFKFISYAVWWIRQAILKALQEQSRIVHVPANRLGLVYQLRKASAVMSQHYGREPSPDEISREFEDLPPEQIERILQESGTHFSMDQPLSSTEDGGSLHDMLEFSHTPDHDEALMASFLNEKLFEFLDELSERDGRIVYMYWGLDNRKRMTLEEIGGVYDLTKERVRQILEKSVNFLKQRFQLLFADDARRQHLVSEAFRQRQRQLLNSVHRPKPAPKQKPSPWNAQVRERLRERKKHRTEEPASPLSNRQKKAVEAVDRLTPILDQLSPEHRQALDIFYGLDGCPAMEDELESAISSDVSHLLARKEEAVQVLAQKANLPYERLKVILQNYRLSRLFAP